MALDTNGDGAITEDEFVRLGSEFSGVRIYQILQVPRYALYGKYERKTDKHRNVTNLIILSYIINYFVCLSDAF